MRPQRSSRATLVLTLPLFAVLLIPDAARADPFVVPSAETNTEGNGDNGFPFNLGGNTFWPTSMRYQQVYAAAEFGAAPLRITGIAFRPDAAHGSAFSTTIGSIQISLSTTPRATGALSARFADNVGDNAKVVHAGALALSSAFTGAALGPKAFDILIPLAQPFIYNPLRGNLLLDIRNFTGEATTQFDAVFSAHAQPSRTELARVWSATSVHDETGNMAVGGLVTQFEATPVAAVPEPGTMLLVGGALAGWRWRRRRR